MNEPLKAKVLEFLYKWVNDGKLANLRKGMVEELEGFVNDELSAAETAKISERMRAVQVIEANPPTNAESSNEKDPQ